METNGYTITFPEGYEKKELPYFNEWVKALESGEYTQGASALQTGNRYCCLGVLSKIQGRLVNECDDGYRLMLAKNNPCRLQLGQMGNFPEGVTVTIPRHSPFNTLVHCNDNDLSFNQIAEIIKQIWKPIGIKESKPD
jgi:hypothetical protein